MTGRSASRSRGRRSARRRHDPRRRRDPRAASTSEQLVAADTGSAVSDHGPVRDGGPGTLAGGRRYGWAYTHVPQQVRGDAGGDLTGTWDERADRAIRGAGRGTGRAPGAGVPGTDRRPTRLLAHELEGGKREPRRGCDQRRNGASSPTADLPAHARPSRQAGDFAPACPSRDVRSQQRCGVGAMRRLSR